jgi:AcrR family transcriptional regulator
MPAIDSTQPMRADARRNREKLLRAASEHLAAAGPDVPLELIARTAGVGIGTLYRHFPTREALIEAVYRNEVNQLCASAGELLTERPPDEALAEWMQRYVSYAATKRGLLGILRTVATSQSDLFPTTRERLLAALAELLEAGISAGRIRPDVDSEDVLTSINAIWTIAADGDQWAARAKRVVELLMDALRLGPASDSPPPVGPPRAH